MSQAPPYSRLYTQINTLKHSIQKLIPRSKLSTTPTLRNKSNRTSRTTDRTRRNVTPPPKSTQKCTQEAYQCLWDKVQQMEQQNDMVEEQTKMLQEMLQHEREERKKLEEKLKVKKNKSIRLKTETCSQRTAATLTLNTNKSPLPSQRNHKTHNPHPKGDTTELQSFLLCNLDEYLPTTHVQPPLQEQIIKATRSIGKSTTISEKQHNKLRLLELVQRLLNQ